MKGFKFNRICFGIILLCAVIFISSCKKNEEDKKDETTETKAGLTFTAAGELVISFNHLFKDQALKFSPDSFVTKAGDTLYISDVRYYISNITLTDAGGADHNAGTYTLMNAAAPAPITLQGIAAGNYTKLSFYVGVEPTNNHTLNNNEPALDPANGMSWGWNTGYIFYRIVGFFGAARSGFSFDIGGDANLMKVEFDLTSYKVKGVSALAAIDMRVNEMFESPTTYDLKTQVTSIHEPTAPENAILKANMLDGMFTLKQLQ